MIAISRRPLRNSLRLFRSEDRFINMIRSKISKADRLGEDPSNSQKAEKIAKSVRSISRQVTDLYLSARRFTEGVLSQTKERAGLLNGRRRVQ